MNTIELARRMAELHQPKDACRAYTMALREGVEPEEELEGAAYILQNGGDYRISYTSFHKLYNAGFHREDIMPVMREIFYEPNIRLLKGRYERNCRLLQRYKFCFRQDFIPFDDLPIQFFPYNEHNGYVPYDRAVDQFGEFVDVRDAVVSRNFFKDLEKPILATDVYSQYELEYLNDNVRRSEDIGRENHLYLHYSDWGTFCAWMQVLNLRPLISEQSKIVFLFEDELKQYPIDFKERYGVDYSQYPVQPVRVSEVNRLIWHTQLNSHNGGDFFNEIFDAHPNLLAAPSVMFDSMEESVAKVREVLEKAGSLKAAIKGIPDYSPRVVEELYHMRRDLSDKDLLVAMFMEWGGFNDFVDAGSRIVPALFFQPHFHNVVFSLHVDRAGRAVLHSDQYDKVRKSPLFQDFKYIKTFTPMRRFTTSHGATVRFMYASAEKAAEENPDSEVKTVVSDAIMERILNRSFMIDRQDRLYHDSILVRFEDGKLNGKATFTALAAFLDLPYTESMTYCSEKGVRDIDHEGNVVGFDPATVYRTYDDYVNDSERYMIEYFLQDAYRQYGYDFQYYDGDTLEPGRITALLERFTTMDHYIRETWRRVYENVEVKQNGQDANDAVKESVRNSLLEKKIRSFHQNRRKNADILTRKPYFVNRDGQPLHFTPMLQLDPALLENPIYH